MEHRLLGKTGMNVSILGFGGAEIGYEQPEREAVSRLLNSALDAGLNAVDTAECYSAGADETSSEYLIGETIAHRRAEYFLFTKCGHSSGLAGADWDPELLERSIERSLRRLKTDVIDLLQLHSCDASVLQAGDVIAVLQRARDSGKVRFLGYSGDAGDAVAALDSGAFDTLQTSVNIADQQSIELTLPRAKAAGIGVIAKRPIANAVWRYAKEAETPEYPRLYWRRLQQLNYDFLKAAEFDQAVATALRFTLTAPGVSTAIIGTKNPDRWSSNAALLANGATLPDEDYAAIRNRWKEIAGADWVGQR